MSSTYKILRLNPLLFSIAACCCGIAVQALLEHYLSPRDNVMVDSPFLFLVPATFIVYAVFYVYYGYVVWKANPYRKKYHGVFHILQSIIYSSGLLYGYYLMCSGIGLRNNETIKYMLLAGIVSYIKQVIQYAYNLQCISANRKVRTADIAFTVIALYVPWIAVWYLQPFIVKGVSDQVASNQS